MRYAKSDFPHNNYQHQHTRAHVRTHPHTPEAGSFAQSRSLIRRTPSFFSNRQCGCTAALRLWGWTAEMHSMPISLASSTSSKSSSAATLAMANGKGLAASTRARAHKHTRARTHARTHARISRSARNVETKFTNSLSLCPSQMRDALFTHSRARTSQCVLRSARQQQQQQQRTNERTNEQTNERTNERTIPRIPTRISLCSPPRHPRPCCHHLPHPRPHHPPAPWR